MFKIKKSKTHFFLKTHLHAPLGEANVSLVWPNVFKMIKRMNKSVSEKHVCDTTSS